MVAATGILIGGHIRVEVAVDGVIAGLTEGRKVQLDTGSHHRRLQEEVDATGAAEEAVGGVFGTVLWDRESDERIISVPLASMATHSIRLSLYRESHSNRRSSTVVGSCQRDRQLHRLWAQVNR